MTTQTPDKSRIHEAVQAGDWSTVFQLAVAAGGASSATSTPSRKKRNHRINVTDSRLARYRHKSLPHIHVSKSCPRAKQTCEATCTRISKDMARDGAVMLSNLTIISTTSNAYREVLKHASVVEEYGKLTADPESEETVANITKISGQRWQVPAMLSTHQMEKHEMFADRLVTRSFNEIFRRLWSICKAVLKQQYPSMDLDIYPAEGPVARRKVAFTRSYLPGDNAQLVHSDSMFQRNINALIALTDIDEPPYHVPYRMLAGKPLVQEDLDPRVDTAGKYIDADTRNKVSERFRVMLLRNAALTEPTINKNKKYGLGRKTADISSLRSRKTEKDMETEREIYRRLDSKVRNAKEIVELGEPVTGYCEGGSPEPMKAGDTLLFFGDFIHFGPRLTERKIRKLLFVPFQLDGLDKSDDEAEEEDESEGGFQLHAGALAELVMGRHNTCSATNETIFSFMKALEDRTKIPLNSDVVSLSGRYSDDRLWTGNAKKEIENMNNIWVNGKVEEEEETGSYKVVGDYKVATQVAF